ncbi:LysR family transcriptional regulator [Evansella cellulosilytica]|uniref:Transcriptional regulator, LysR family n=1 Tax=Evansella cellulosilytica (strain ATCC 21833 / DSM 2522 / FERM P-1141 / JCM 9156 / N-4) TaxID=649639 RepID=E6U2A9_EVAC2|nr:LysR family transcriptional regulator [Evansella cellulosilytica]ADU30487.1 transcriptional regulator, LysR family [Evansella cellulosilytica DSM 2522]
MEFRQIKYFIEVADREHVTDAAYALHVAQSAVSRQIFNLEKELGVDLFIRDGRSVKLTPIGKLFLERVKHAMNLMEDAKKEVLDYLEPEKGTVRIAFPSSLAAYTLPRAIYAFRQLYPEAQFHLKQALYNELVDSVRKGYFNLALIAPIVKEERNIDTKVLFHENVVALLPANHPMAYYKTIDLLDLIDDPFVLLPEGFTYRKIVLDACQEIGFEPKIAFEGDDVDALKGLVSAGLGVTLMPEMTLMDSIPKSTVKIPLRKPNLKRSVGIITPKDRSLLPTEQLFYNFITNFY